MTDLNSLFGELSVSFFHLLSEHHNPHRKTSLSIAIGSACGGEGRTFVAERLALYSAWLSEYNLLLVDAAWDRPDLTARYGGDGKPGLSDVFVNPNQVPDLLPTGVPNLHVVGAGRTPSLELLYREGRLKHFLQWASAIADGLLFDMPSFQAGASAVVASVDRVLMVVDARRTPRSVARSMLTKVPKPKSWGIVLNRCPNCD